MMTGLLSDSANLILQFLLIGKLYVIPSPVRLRYVGQLVHLRGDRLHTVRSPIL